MIVTCSVVSVLNAVQTCFIRLRHRVGARTRTIGAVVSVPLNRRAAQHNHLNGVQLSQYV